MTASVSATYYRFKRLHLSKVPLNMAKRSDGTGCTQYGHDMMLLVVNYISRIICIRMCKVGGGNFEQSLIPNMSIFHLIRSIMSRPKNAVTHLVCKD